MRKNVSKHIFTLGENKIIVMKNKLGSKEIIQSLLIVQAHLVFASLFIVFFFKLMVLHQQ